MTGFLKSAGGVWWQLPVLTQWELLRTDGDPCGAFSVSFMADGETAKVLERAAFFEAVENGQTVFTGVVDEYELTMDQNGLRATAAGRDMAALLLDNQCRALEFQTAQLEDILSRYARPFGVTAIRAEDLPPVNQFAVQTGDSCWQALSGWCRHSAGVRPYFLADGTLCLERAPAGKTLGLTMYQAPVSVRLLGQRYGVISEQIILDYTRKSVETVRNPGFDGCRRQVAARSGKTWKAAWRTAAQRIEDSMREAVRLEATLAGGFAAAPWDVLEVALENPGVTGRFAVTAAATKLDSRGLRTELTMRKLQ